MQEFNEKIKTYLEERFKKVRETENGFRINVKQLNKRDLSWLEDVECTNEILIKRSGTGLVIIIE